MAAESQVAVVIPSWNSGDLLPGCLDSIAVQTPAPELLVVDNGSSDGTLEMLVSRGVPHVSLTHNSGFAAAMNLAVARTSAPAILVLNADTVLEPGAVKRLAEVLFSDPSLGGVQPRLLQMESGATGDPSLARLYSAGQALTADGRAFEIAAGEHQTPPSLQSREIFGVCGAAALLRRDLFTVVGGYDESYFSFYEDVDLNVRARIAGWRFAYEPASVVWHVGNASWLSGVDHPSAWNARLVARNRIATQAKFIPAAVLPRIVAIEVGALFRAALQQRLAATFRGKLEGLARLPTTLRERRRLTREGKLELASRWLGRRGDPIGGTAER